MIIYEVTNGDITKSETVSKMKASEVYKYLMAKEISNFINWYSQNQESE